MGKLFVVSAPSGAGKTSLVNALIRRLNPPYMIHRVVTYTSKTPRSNEIDGYDYHFITPQEFETRIRDGFFIEYSTAYGAYYGSPRCVLDEIKKEVSYVLIVDRAGAKQVVQQEPTSILIWLNVSIPDLENRLAKRAGDSPEDIKKRLFQAQQEIDEERLHAFYHHHVINDNFSTALFELESIVKHRLTNGL